MTLPQRWMKPLLGDGVRNAGGSGHQHSVQRLISPHGPPDAIYRAWRLARFQLVTSDVQPAEIRRASRYPKFQSILQLARVGVMVNNMQRTIVLKKLVASQRRAIDTDRNAAVLQSVEQGIDQRLVGEQLIPRGRLQIGRNEGRCPAIALIHQAEEGI